MNENLTGGSVAPSASTALPTALVMRAPIFLRSSTARGLVGAGLFHVQKNAPGREAGGEAVSSGKSYFEGSHIARQAASWVLICRMVSSVSALE